MTVQKFMSVKIRHLQDIIKKTFPETQPLVNLEPLKKINQNFQEAQII
jgi:hypothetical protein